MKIGKYEITNKWLVIMGVVMATLLLLFYLSLPVKPPAIPQQTIDEVKIALEKVYTERLDEKTKIINDQGKIIKDKDIIIQKKEGENKILRVNIESSIAREKVWSQKYIALKEEYSHVIVPSSDKEMRDRYTSAGYPPAPVGICGPGYICFSTGYK